jgi:uncharacterized linocin/CFP29 family protein
MDNRYLGRNEAPVSAECWKLLDEAMVMAAKGQLAGRRLVSMEGPFGLGLKGIPLGDCETEEGVFSSAFVPVTMIGTSFTLGKRDLAAADRDLFTLDLAPVACAAIACAQKEDALVFIGGQGAPGLMTAEGTNSLTLAKWDKIGTAADQMIAAVTSLDDAGIHGPSVLALAPAAYNILLRRYPQTDGTELDHIRSIIGGDVVKAPVLKKGGVLLASDRQYCSLVFGQDMSIGFFGPEGMNLNFGISESFALVLRVPEAVCVLR